MKKYQLISKSRPELTKYGSAREIYEHAKKLGYKGKVVIKDGYELPIGGDIVLEGDYVKKPNSLRMSHRLWHLLDQITEKDETISNRVEAIGHLFEVYMGIQDIGPALIKTAEGEREFASLLDIVRRRQFFEDQGLESITVSFKKQEKAPE